MIQSGRLLDLRLYQQIDDDYCSSDSISENLVSTLTEEMHKWTVKKATDSEREKNGIEPDKPHKKYWTMLYTLEPKFKMRLALLSHHSRSLRSKYISVAQDVSPGPEEADEESKIDLDLGKDIVEKIAYLSASFRVFAEMVVRSEVESGELCAKVERNIVAAFKKQLGYYTAKEILEEYILNLLKKGQYARIRGKNSDNSNTRIWYDPEDVGEKGCFLILSKNYFDSLKAYLPMVNISKRDFEKQLANTGILYTVTRGNQQRRTFEVVVKKGRDKWSVLKINADALSDQFSKSAREYLDQMSSDKSPLRSAKP